MKTIRIMSIAAGLLLSGATQAALIDRGSGLLYDDVLNITWLQDANYAKTSGYDIDGRMSLSTANTWAANLSFGGYDDWRLPSTTDTGSAGCNWSFGGTDCGLNSTGSELAHMYYNNLGLKAVNSVTGAYQADFGVFRNGTLGGQNDVGLVNNLQSDAYWSGTAYAPAPDNLVWVFNTHYGYQFHYFFDDIELFAWAVRPGDVAVAPPVNDVPEPSSVMLLGLALAGMGVARRRGRFGA